MDVNQHNFETHLPWLLKELAQSSFVAIDFEFSGIALAFPAQGHRIISLQERYLENKCAAEKYQILQVGLTFCSENPKDGYYLLKPFNISLSPKLDEALKINRDWMGSSASIGFLLGHGFSVDALFKDGVRYLTRSEEQDARGIVDQSFKRLVTWEPRDEEPQALRFRLAAREVIDYWLFRGRCSESLRIPPFEGFHDIPQYLDYQQKHFLTKIINIEYPHLHVSLHGSFVRVKESTKEANNEILQKKKDQAELIIQKSIGFRRITDALTGRDLASLPTKSFADLLTTTTSFTLEELAYALKEHLRDNRAVLVGHNCFTDLVFLYHHFIGKLPETVDEFQILFHQVFPQVIDTKYLYTSYQGCDNARSSLSEACRQMASVASPTITVEDKYWKYMYGESLHEAGYDSMLTAVLFLKLSVQIHLQKPAMPRWAMGSLGRMQLQFAHPQSYDAQELFDSLMNARSGQADSEVSDLMDFTDSVDCVAYLPTPRDSPQAPAETEDTVAKMVSDGVLLPRIDADFWTTYGNKVRVFGTHEGVVDLVTRDMMWENI